MNPAIGGKNAAMERAGCAGACGGYLGEKHRSTGRNCVGEDTDLKIAWLRFEGEIRDILFWYRGNKYWRCFPSARRVPFYDEFGNYLYDCWRVLGRINITTGDIPGAVPVEFG